MNPFELADYLAAAATLLIGVAAGKRLRPRPPAPLRPICTCGHGYGTHVDGKGCQAETLTVVDERHNQELRNCRCRRYDGPDPAIFGLEAA